MIVEGEDVDVYPNFYHSKNQNYKCLTYSKILIHFILLCLLVSVLQGNKRNSNSIHYQHPALYSRNKMDKHGRKTKTINQNKQTRKSRLGLGIQ